MTSTPRLDKSIRGGSTFDDSADFFGGLRIRHRDGIRVVRQIVPLDIEDIEEEFIRKCRPAGFAIEGFDYAILQSLRLCKDE